MPQLVCATVPSGNCALIFATTHDPPMSQLSSTATDCNAPTYLVALMCPKSHVPVPHLSTAIVNRGDSSCGRSKSRKVGVPIAAKVSISEIYHYVSIENSEAHESKLPTSRSTTRREAQTKYALDLLRVHDRLGIPHHTYILPHRWQLAYRQAVCAYDASGCEACCVARTECCVGYRLPGGTAAGFV